MILTLEPMAGHVRVTVENSDDAKRFCRVAGDIMREGTHEHIDDRLRKSYAEYGERMAKNNTLDWDRRLWDYPVQRIPVPGGAIEVTFGAKLLAKLDLL